ncbi:MAG: flippase [Pseudomonadota bacterium]|nr:flippase [Pseudomonadota bacterium]
MISSVSRFVKNSGFNLIANLSNKISKSLLLILISHTLGVSSMGQLSLALTYLGFGILLSNWGFGNMLIRQIARDRNSTNKYLSHFAITRIALVVITLLALNIVIQFFNYSPETVLVIQIISINLFATTLVNLFYSILIANESLMELSIVYIVTSILRLLICGIAIIHNGTIIQVAIIYTTIEFSVLLISTFIIRRHLINFKITFNLSFALSQIVKAFPFLWIGALMMLDTRAETVIISYFFSEATVGYYSAVSTVLGGITIFSEAIRNTIIPIASRYQLEDECKLTEVIHLLSKYLLIITIPLTIAIFFLSDEIITFFFSASYSSSITMLKITIWSSISYSLTIILSGLLIAKDMEKKVAFSLFVSGALTIILDIILAPMIGVIGIAIIRTATSILQLGLLLWFSYTELKFGIISNKTALFTSLSGLAMFSTAYFLTPLSPWVSIVTSIIVFILMLTALGVLRKEDKSLLVKLYKEFRK